MITIKQGDCLELMKDIPDGSIDCIICDLPYGITRNKWDTVIPFEPLWEQYKRIIKTNGAIVLFGSQPFTSALVMSNVKWFKYDWAWKKPKGTGHLNSKIMPMRDKEDILIFSKSKCTYNAQLNAGAPYSKFKSGKVSKIREQKTYGVYKDGAEFSNENSGFRYPKQVIEFGVVERNTVHPTQKPVPLLEYLIKTYTNEGETVLDNCMGSGSTGVAAFKLNRRFIGIEKDAAYFKIASERIGV